MIPPIAAPERILLMGGPGSGKSTAWINWAQRMERTFVLDTDYAVARMLAGDHTGTAELGGVEWDHYNPGVFVMVPRDWDDYLKFGSFTKKLTTPKDLVVVDMVNRPWDEVKENFVERVYGKQLDEFFIERKVLSVQSGKGGGNPLGDAHGQTWDIINKRYKRWQDDVLFLSRGHVLACAPIAAVDRDSDSQQTLDLFGKWSVKPVGQKNLAYLFHTILLLADTKKGHTLTTIKERDIKGMEQRDYKVAELFDDFVMDYLVLTAGWKLK